MISAADGQGVGVMVADMEPATLSSALSLIAKLRQVNKAPLTSLRFLSMDCHMRVERAGTAYTSRWQKGAVFRAPLAHGDGNYFADDATLDRLEGEGLVAFRYTNENGEVTEAANRNGSARNIAGIFSPNLRVCGLMPHPEDLVDPLMGGTDGLPMFESLAESLVSA